VDIQDSNRKLNEKPRVTLTDKRGRGGVAGGRGYIFQAAYIASHIPSWLADPDFVQFVQESAGDVDVHFTRADGEERWCIQVKNYAVTPAKARKVFSRFLETDTGSPGTYTRFILASPLNEDLKQLRLMVEDLRGAAPFFRLGQDEILDNTWADLETLAQKLELPVDATFLVHKVDFDTDLAGLTDDTNLCDLFVGRLLKLDAWSKTTPKAAIRAYEKLALFCHQVLRRTCSREQVEALIREAVDETFDSLFPEYDDFVARISRVVSDLISSVLTLGSAFHLTHAILEASSSPAEDIWKGCQDELSRKPVSLDMLLFKTRVECYWGMKYAIGTLEELVDVYGDRFEVLREAATRRFHLSDDTARRVYEEERPKVQVEYDRADKALRLFYETEPEAAQNARSRIRQAQRTFERTKPKLHKSYDEYRIEEVEKAVEWAQSAQELSPNDPSLRELMIKMQRKIIQLKMQSAIIRVDRVVLRDRMRKHFGESDLRDICFELDIDYDNLPGEKRADKARELVLRLFQGGRLHELVEICSRLRPSVSWWACPKSEMLLRSSKH